MALDIIGVSGKAGSGKDYVTEHFLRPLGYHRIALADHFKIWAVGRGLATREEVFVTKPPHVRSALQRVGTEEGRNQFGEAIWCNTALAWMEHHAEMWGITNFAVCDVRFVNEVQFVQAQGGRVLRLVAPERVAVNRLTDEARLHPSETSLDDYDGFDAFILTDPEYDVSLAVAQAVSGQRCIPATNPAVVLLRNAERNQVMEARAREDDRLAQQLAA